MALANTITEVEKRDCHEQSRKKGRETSKTVAENRLKQTPISDATAHNTKTRLKRKKNRQRQETDATRQGPNSNDARDVNAGPTDTFKATDGMCAAARSRLSPERAMSDLIDGEEEFVLQPQPLPPSSTVTPFVLEGWNDVEPPAPLPETPSRFSVLRQALRRKILALQAARQKAPSQRIGRLARMMEALRRRWMSLKGGVQWAVGAVSGGRRKRVAEDDCESVDSDHEAKRVRLDDDNDSSTEEQGNGNLDDGNHDFVDVPVPDFDGFDDFGYGQAEDQAATDAILAADFDFQVEDDVNPPPIVEMDVDDAPMAMADAPIEVEAPVAQPDQPAPARQSRPRRAKAPAPVKPASRAKAPARQKRAPKRKGGRRPRQDPLEVLETAHGKGFLIERRFNGTARLTGTFPGVDSNRSSLLHKAAHGGVTITAPARSRITQVAAGANFVMLLTNKGRLMMLGNNAHGQLGCRGRTPRKTLTKICCEREAVRVEYEESKGQVVRSCEVKAWVSVKSTIYIGRT
uniref:WD_REPEATS_REGION domain-containing protein n=1 Tax=Panagrellus redivivus TaxID=6233 RepID=A0A7E4W8X1_PANRE